MERVAFELAQYIGPTAFTLAQEKQSSSLYWLYQELAGEIRYLEQQEEFLQQQEEFLRSCPPAPVEQLQSGDCFGEMSLFLAEPLIKANMTTAIETEILSIPQEAIAAVLDYDKNLLDSLSQEFAKYQREYLTQTMQLPGEKYQEINQILMNMASFATNK